MATARARSKAEKMERQSKVARLRYVQRWSVEQIAEALKVDEKTIDRDLRAIERGSRQFMERELARDLSQVVMEATFAYNDRQQRRYAELAKITSGTVILPAPKEGGSGRVIYVSPVDAARARAQILNDIKADEAAYRQMLQDFGLIDMGDADEEIDTSIDGVDDDAGE
ncbi:MAG TPA: hypothetical protein VK464_16215 [Symbiobacteriaceae bacterium]|nr:hypothetical protein [Symbiobacteriaceae bacterium]